jgi:N-acetylglucosamine-6-phosphate deacetylase
MTETFGKSLLLRNARLVLPEHILPGGTIFIQHGCIASISSDQSHGAHGSEEFDLRGLTIYPGFIDVHIHGAVGVDTMRANAADLDRVSQFLATRGVTGWLPTLVPAPEADCARSIKALTEAMKDQEQAGHLRSQRGARILGVHYEGPFVNSAQCGALHSQFFRMYSSARDLDSLPTIQGNSTQTAKHVMTVAPEINGGVELVRELNRRGWIVSIGHTRAGFDLLDKARKAGAHHLTHFMNAMAPLHHRAPGPVAWGLSHDDVSCDLIADGVHLDSQILRLLLKLKSADRLLLISDAVAAAGMGDGDYEIWGETITVKDGRTSNSRGAIAGSVITMLDAVRFMQSLDVSEVELAKMAATNPARLLGIYDDCGSLEEGKRADLVALDQDDEVVLTMVGGAIVFDARKTVKSEK